MAIAHTNTPGLRTANITSPFTFVVDRGSSGTSGRILIVQIAIASSTVTVTPAAGFTLIRETSFTGGKLLTYWHLVNSDPATWTFSTDLAANTRYCSISSEFSGVDTTNPIDVSNQGTDNSTSVSSAQVDPAYNEDMLIWVGAIANVSTWTAPGSPAAFTMNASGAAAAAISLASARLLLSSGAATGAVAGTASVSGQNAAQLIALKDASSTPDTGGAIDVTIGNTPDNAINHTSAFAYSLTDLSIDKSISNTPGMDFGIDAPSYAFGGGPLTSVVGNTPDIGLAVAAPTTSLTTFVPSIAKATRTSIHSGISI